MNGLLGFRWTLIAGRIPGRTSNDIKNYWNTYLSKKIQSEADKSAALVKHNTCTSAVHSETLGSEFETCPEQKQGDEEEEDTVSFWRRLLLEGEYRELDLRVKNKEILQVEHEEEDDDDWAGWFASWCGHFRLLCLNNSFLLFFLSGLISFISLYKLNFFLDFWAKFWKENNNLKSNIY